MINRVIAKSATQLFRPLQITAIPCKYYSGPGDLSRPIEGARKVEEPYFNGVREEHSKTAEKGVGPPNEKDLNAKRRNEKDKPVKFSTSKAHVNYRASLNFYGDTRDLPDSHNTVIIVSVFLSLLYLIFLRDERDDGGGLAFIKPLHETMPQMAIPLLKSAIAENRKFGNDTKKLEEKLAEYMKDPKKYGGSV